MSQAILWMKWHPQDRKKMGIAARKRVKEVFGQDKMIERIVRLYKEVCER